MINIVKNIIVAIINKLFSNIDLDNATGRIHFLIIVLGILAIGKLFNTILGTIFNLFLVAFNGTGIWIIAFMVGIGFYLHRKFKK